jgi:TfoX/Sxy family transcriptional regulator of competence genes
MDNEQDLARSNRAALAQAGPFRETQMFGGIGFLLDGKLVAGASNEGLLLHVGEELQTAALTQPGIQPMIRRGQEMPGYIRIDPPGLNKRAVRGWLRLAIPYVQALPAKPSRRKAAA